MMVFYFTNLKYIISQSLTTSIKITFVHFSSNILTGQDYLPISVLRILFHIYGNL